MWNRGDDMKKILIVLSIVALFFACSMGSDDIIGGDTPESPATPETPAVPETPYNPASPEVFIREVIPVPEYLYDVATGAWLIRPAVVAKNIDAKADPAAKVCTTEGSFYLFTGDKKIVEYSIKQEEWYTMLRACIVTKELYEYEGKEWDYIAVPRYVAPYVAENPEPVVPLLHFYVLDKDNNIMFDYDMYVIEPDDPIGWYNTCISNRLITYDVEQRDVDNPERAPHRWIGGGTKEVVME
jgi:hypothetical protein